ncbi:hypothetical protein [Actinocrispum sp. NPDC049592]|uniref:hypothetical protein n=1 Tax=Actinocrispum sp. NPDC049592 TaxID=3154835 RepID=UPI003413544F
MNTRRAAVLFCISTIIALGGCSTATEGVPQQAPTGTDEGKVVIRNPKQISDKLDCAKTAPADAVGKAVGATVVPDTQGVNTGSCAYKVPASGSVKVDGLVTASVITHPEGAKTAEFEGNTAFEYREGDKQCDTAVAVAKNMWLRSHMLLYSGGDVCAKSKTLLKTMMDALPKDAS